MGEQSDKIIRRASEKIFSKLDLYSHSRKSLSNYWRGSLVESFEGKMEEVEKEIFDLSCDMDLLADSIENIRNEAKKAENNAVKIAINKKK